MSQKTQYSSSALAILEKAKLEAMDRCHENIATEHFVYALCFVKSRVFSWISSRLFPDKTSNEAESLVRLAVVELLDAPQNKLFKKGQILHSNPSFLDLCKIFFHWQKK